MSSGANKRGIIAFKGLALLAVVISLAVWVGTTANDNPAQANHQITIGLDTDTSGNSALALGALQACRVITAGQIIDVDLYITGVDDIASWEAYIKYNQSKLTITKPGGSAQGNNARFLLQQAQASNNLQNTSENLPDVDNPGIYRVGAADLAVTPQYPDPDPIGFTHKSGVLVRLQIQGLPGPGGFSTLQISPFSVGVGTVGPFVKDSSGVIVGDNNADTFVDSVVNGGIVVGAGTCSDSDGDGVPDGNDNCPATYNPTQTNFDGDSQGDACDIDDDNDGLVDGSEPSGCQFDPDCDDDNVSDGPNDPDGGGPIVAGPDNCIQVANTSQTNSDGDAQGDACDPDDDNDGVLDGSDNCPTVYNPSQANMDGDSMGDACDLEDDGDGFDDTAEVWVGTDPMDNCGNPSAQDYSLAWPADLKMSGPIPTNGKIDIQDLQTFILPVRRINTAPGDANYDIRWDLVPGPGPFTKHINIQDMTYMVTVTPLMFGGATRAFGGPTCTP